MPPYAQVLTLNRISHQFYETLIAALLKGCPLPAPMEDGPDAVTLHALRDVLLAGDDPEGESAADEQDESLVVVNVNLDENENKKLVVNQVLMDWGVGGRGSGIPFQPPLPRLFQTY